MMHSILRDSLPYPTPSNITLAARNALSQKRSHQQLPARHGTETVVVDISIADMLLLSGCDCDVGIERLQRGANVVK